MKIDLLPDEQERRTKNEDESEVEDGDFAPSKEGPLELKKKEFFPGPDKDHNLNTNFRISRRTGAHPSIEF